MPRSSLEASPLPVSVKEARKLLGKSSQSLTDDQITEIILNLQVIARDYLHRNSSKNTLGVY